ncbi:MAG: molybdopterin-dependent oxidoreductase, partial [Pirellulales bacterium]|nr:molybdopterin-dependent oxidoreductase [Pirellulales bacterium]
MHLQVNAGEDAALVSGMINIILSENLYDQEFCRHHVVGLEELKQQVEPFVPDYVARRCGIEPDQLIAAARMFGTANRGVAVGG